MEYSERPDLITFSTKNKHQVLSRSRLDRLKEATYQVLEEVGVVYPSPEARRIFADQGAEADWDTGIIKIPKALVERAMKSALRSFLRGGREKRFDPNLDGSHSFFSTDGCGTSVIDRKLARNATPGTRTLSGWRG